MRYRIAKADRISASSPIQEGEILKHRSGMIIVRCPICRTMSLGATRLKGTGDAPTLADPIRCGCAACRALFTVEAGQLKVLEGKGGS